MDKQQKGKNMWKTQEKLIILLTEIRKGDIIGENFEKWSKNMLDVKNILSKCEHTLL